MAERTIRPDEPVREAPVEEDDGLVMTNFEPKVTRENTEQSFVRMQKPRMEAEEIEDDEIFVPRREERVRRQAEPEEQPKRGGFLSSFRNNDNEQDEYDDIDFDMPAITRRHRRDQ